MFCLTFKATQNADSDGDGDSGDGDSDATVHPRVPRAVCAVCGCQANSFRVATRQTFVLKCSLSATVSQSVTTGTHIHTVTHTRGRGNTHSCLAHQRKVQLVEVARINMPQTEPSTQRS